MKNCIFAFLMASMVMFVSCSSKPTTSPTTFQMNGAGIFVTALVSTGLTEMSAGIVDSNAQPVTNAAVTLSYSGGSAPLTYVTNGSSTSTETLSYSGGSTVITCAAYQTSNGGWTYTANQPYTVTAIFGGKTYSASEIAPGNITFTPGSGSLTITWVGGGNENDLTAINGSYSKTFGPNLTSPYTLLNSSLPGYSPGSYTLNMGADTTQYGCFPGASSYSEFVLDYIATTTY